MRGWLRAAQVFPEEARAVGKPSLRRWIYNSARCGKCNGPVTSWQIQTITMLLLLQIFAYLLRVGFL